MSSHSGYKYLNPSVAGLLSEKRGFVKDRTGTRQFSHRRIDQKEGEDIYTVR